jgi:pimeloyl-ACP methyl ester carboxylesterase
MHSTIEGAGVALAAYAHGEPSAPAVLLIHGIASDALAWETTTRELAGDGFRAIVYDRRGYGASQAPQPYTATTVMEQAQDAVAVLDGLAVDRAIVAGDGFGSLIALDVLRRFPERVTAVVASDPVLLELVPDGSEVLSEQRLALESALRDGGPAAAVERWLGGRVEGDALTRATAAHEAFFADFAGLPSWPATRRELRAMNAPVAVVTSPYSRPHVKASAAALLALLPNATADDRGDLATAVRDLNSRI